MDWLRWHHGTVTDPKLALVAKRENTNTAAVVAVWAWLLEAASQNTQRGLVGNLDFEAIDFGLGLDDGLSERICGRLVERGLLADDGLLVSWDKRQPKREREDTTAADRKRTERERKKPAKSHQDEPCHAMSRQVTPRGEEIREEESRAPRAPENPEPPTPEDPPADKTGGFEGHSQEDVAKAIEDGKKPVEAAKALKAAGCVDVHSTRPELVQALADGITIDELVAIAEQHRGKPLVYLISTARRRRLDATATAGSSSPGKPEPKCNPDGMSPRITDPDEIKRRQAEADAAMRQQYPELYAQLNGASA